MLAGATGFGIAPAIFVHAPGWFYGLAVVGVVPVVLTHRPMSRADAHATILFTILSVVAGLVGVVAITFAVLTMLGYSAASPGR